MQQSATDGHSRCFLPHVLQLQVDEPFVQRSSGSRVARRPISRARVIRPPKRPQGVAPKFFDERTQGRLILERLEYVECRLGRRLREMDDSTKAGLAMALKSASEPALVRSTFDMPDAQRTAIQNALNETFSSEISVQFETMPDLISGIELTTNGQKLAWSIAGYLLSLEKGVDEMLKEKGKSEAKTVPESEQGAHEPGT